MKACYRCCVKKPVDSFNKSKRNKDGLLSCCRECLAVSKKEIRQRVAKRLKVIPVEKMCSICHLKKHSDAFYKDKYTVTGLSGRCKECHAITAKKSISKCKKFFVVHPITQKKCCCCQQVKLAAEFFSNKGSVDGHTQYCRVCMDKRVRKGKTSTTWWYRRCFGIGRAIPTDAVTPKEVAQLYEVHPYCEYCGVSLRGELRSNAQIDHKISKHRGGTDKIENLCICCADCNRMKYTKTDTEFRAFLLEYVSRFDAPLTKQITVHSLSDYAQKEPQP